MSVEDAARLAYETYAAAMEWEMVPFRRLTARERGAWRKVAETLQSR